MRTLIPWKRNERNVVPKMWNDDWFDRALEKPFNGMPSPFSNSYSFRMPSVDITEDKNEFTIKAEVPGMTEKDLDLTWHDGVLRIRGVKKAEKEEKKRGRYYRECSYGSFSRDIALGEAVDWKETSANYKNGVLTVKLPKTEQARKVIEIKVN